MKIRFKFLSGDTNWLDYGGKWVSQKLNNGDWDYWMVIELTDMWDATGEEDQDKYCVDLSAVSPQAAGKELDKALESYGLSDKPGLCDLVKVACLHGYGTHARLKSWSGNNAHKLLRAAKKEAMTAEFMFGFYMNRQQNAIGSTGWDFIKGDILGGLKSNSESQ